MEEKMKRRPTEARMRTVVRLLALLCKRIESIGRAASCDRDAYHLRDRKSTRLNSSHLVISYAVFCLKKTKHKLTHKPPSPVLSRSPTSTSLPSTLSTSG